MTTRCAETRRVNLKWRSVVNSMNQRIDSRSTHTVVIGASDDDAVAVTGSTLIISLVWGLFRDEGSKDGKERVHY